jgi:hypothetical protein
MNVKPKRVYSLQHIAHLFRKNGIGGRTLVNLKREGIKAIPWIDSCDPYYPADEVDDFIAMVKR